MKAFIPPYLNYCSQVWHHCGKRNTKKLEKVNERALRYVYKDKTSSYSALLEQIGLCTSLENRRIQDMIIQVNNCIMGRAPSSILRFIKKSSTKYSLRRKNTLVLPKVKSTTYGIKSWQYTAAKAWNEMDNKVRDTAGTKEFPNKIRAMTFTKFFS